MKAGIFRPQANRLLYGGQRLGMPARLAQASRQLHARRHQPGFGGDRLPIGGYRLVGLPPKILVPAQLPGSSSPRKARAE